MSTLTTLVLVLNIGTVKIELLPDAVPKHVAQIQSLVEQRLMMHRSPCNRWLMAQTGDVLHGNYNRNKGLVGTGGSTLANIPAEFNKVSHQRGCIDG